MEKVQSLLFRISPLEGKKGPEKGLEADGSEENGFSGQWE